MAEIVLDHLSKAYPGGVVAVDDVSLRIGDGEFIVLVGPSGCGKSTLLRLIAGLEEASQGTIAIGDADVTTAAPRRRDIAMVFQSYALYPHMSVRQNIAYGLKVRRTPKDEPGGASRRSLPCSASRNCSTGAPRSCPAGSASGLRWAARSCASRRRS